ncbi:histone deacetylase 14, chloroplastic isoform X5 [Beta vulgaris subsp. vulgaris]|uniref:histone deacetylase 14, chloroplastic isoform X5 n=1 Tax=Beta vulgaris subsp. vulgaris TaxID=3555 RepID=UPI0025497D70|nr:histone deacetylase 14, chloroplastic isoform X5 [Beta vulgaris subsp. vulgaris]
MEGLQLFSPPLFSHGTMLPSLEHSLCTWKDPLKLRLFIGRAKNSCVKNLISGRRRFISCSTNMAKDATISSDIQLANAKVIYSIAPATGHNQESHPECNLRVPAIVGALEKMELTAKVMDQASERGILHIEGSGPTYATASTFQDSSIAAGAGLAVLDAVVAASRKSPEPPSGFALIRPPGHHAVPEGPMGFCVFGNIAIAARYAQRVHGLKRIFIIDFDVHHGNGTHDAFYEDPDIYFLSTHQDGSYPGTGKIHEVGRGQGEGTSLNLPLPGGSGDVAMRTVFDEVIVPCAQRFKPDIILVSAGYDGHLLDPLASLQLTTGTYYMLAASIKQLAKELCGGRCVFFLEGGYNLESLSYSVADSFRALLGEPSRASEFDNPAFLYEEPSTRIKQAIEKAKAIHSL